MPNAKTIRELRRISYAITAKGEFPDVTHRDGSFGFTEYAYAMGASQPDVPQTIEEARAMPDGEQWNTAAEREIASLKERQVHKLVPRTAVPPGRKRIKSKWVFKRKADGSFKGRLVVQGWNQVPGLDYGSTFAPVCRLQSIRMLACTAVQFNLELDQMDVSTAFLYADILENVFVEQPPGFEVKNKDGGDLVMQLQKSLYGLAQSPSNWFHTIDPLLVEIGFVPLKSDTCIYLYDHDDVQVYLTLYVDDLLLAGDNSNAISTIKKKLKQRFNMTDMGGVKLVLGMEIKRDRNQERFGMSECKPTSTPGYGSELSKKQPEDTLLGEEETGRYQDIVGCLMYIAQVLRYDIMYATGQLARPMAKPSKIHMVADSNWANNPDNGKSTSCYLTMLGNEPLVSEGRISIHYIPTDSNPADIGTKHLNKHRLKHLLDIISSFNVNDFISNKFKLSKGHWEAIELAWGLEHGGAFKHTARGQNDELSLLDKDDTMDAVDEIHGMEVLDGFRLQEATPPALDNSLLQRVVLFSLSIDWFSGLITRRSQQGTRQPLRLPPCAFRARPKYTQHEAAVEEVDACSE
ncbi:unnamed protein product [Ectocarpus sp. CCAP 1310/34]|nr:unnamed protein product [Ectocarpus sp. CCAP 1310/34]